MILLLQIIYSSRGGYKGVPTAPAGPPRTVRVLTRNPFIVGTNGPPRAGSPYKPLTKGQV